MGTLERAEGLGDCGSVTQLKKSQKQNRDQYSDLGNDVSTPPIARTSLAHTCVLVQSPRQPCEASTAAVTGTRGTEKEACPRSHQLVRPLSHVALWLLAAPARPQPSSQEGHPVNGGHVLRDPSCSGSVASCWLTRTCCFMDDHKCLVTIRTWVRRLRHTANPGERSDTFSLCPSFAPTHPAQQECSPPAPSPCLPSPEHLPLWSSVRCPFLLKSLL